LPPGGLGERWLAFNESDNSDHIAHRVRLSQDKADQRRFIAAVEALSSLSHPHLLPIEQFSLGIAGGAWVVTPFTGSHDGLVTLSSLVRDKGGCMTAPETERALLQL